MKHQELLKGLIRLHILHHAAKDEFYGQWMIHGARPSWLHAKPGDALPDAPPARAPRIYEVARGTAGPHLPARLPRHGIGQGGKQARRDPGPRAYRRAEADAPALMSRNARSSPPADASGWLHTSTEARFRQSYGLSVSGQTESRAQLASISLLILVRPLQQLCQLSLLFGE